MTLGSCTVRLSSRTQDGIRCPGFFGPASDSPSVLDLESGTSEDLGGAGVIGDTTGVAMGRCSTTTATFPTVTRSSIMAILTVAVSATAALTTAASATATLTTAASATATRSTEVRAPTGSQECTPALSVALITAEMSEAFPPAGDRALEVAASMEVVPMAVAVGTR